jgi:hypothetical protein
MADDSTDTAFGFIMFILFLALIGYAAGGMSSSSSSTTGTTGGASPSLPPLEGSSVSSCTGTLKQDEIDGTNSIQLKVWVDPMDAGTKCATARTSTAGTLKVTLAYTADKTQKVSGTDSCEPGVCTPKASVQVNGTDNYCVSAVAERTGTTSKVTIAKVVEPCTMKVPATDPASPWPGWPAPSDNKEVEEGY